MQHFGAARRGRDLDKDPQTVAGGQKDILDQGAGLSVDVEAKRTVGALAQADAVDGDIFGARVDDSDRTRATSHGAKHRIQVHRIL